MKSTLKTNNAKVAPRPADRPTNSDLQLFDVVIEKSADGSGHGQMFLVVERVWSEGKLELQRVPFDDNEGRLALLQQYGYVPGTSRKDKKRKKQKEKKKHQKKKGK